MTREQTLTPNPARYLPGHGASHVRETEAETIRHPDMRRTRGSKAEYLRDVRATIGWDLGQDATLSFVECAGGEVARTFHGRPMWTGNPKAVGF